MPGTAYSNTPPGWTTLSRRSIGPFTTHVTYQQSDGTTVSGRLAPTASTNLCFRGSVAGASTSTGAARHASWWIGILFAAGSACFLVGPIPWFLDLVGPAAGGAVFFICSLVFTSAASLQWLETINADPGPGKRAGRLKIVTFEPRRIDW